MNSNLLAKIILIPFLAILAGFFLIACEKPEGPSADTERLNKLAEQVETLNKKVDQLSQKLDELSKKLAAPARGGELVVCQPAEPPGLDPTANTAAAIDRVVFANIYEGLVKVDRTGAFVPGLATAWAVSPATMNSASTCSACTEASTRTSR